VRKYYLGALKSSDGKFQKSLHLVTKSEIAIVSIVTEGSITTAMGMKNHLVTVTKATIGANTWRVNAGESISATNLVAGAEKEEEAGKGINIDPIGDRVKGGKLPPPTAWLAGAQSGSGRRVSTTQ
jgi:hypothetical protein